MEEKDDLEKLILAHRDALDGFEPPEGHLERFRGKLEMERKVRHFSWGTVWKVAAAVVFVFLAVNQARIWLAPEEIAPATLAALSPEYAEVEYYYTSAIAAGMKDISVLAGAGVIPEAENQIMQQEFREFEERYKSLQEELKANPYDERVINAMIEYYQAKLNVIHMVMSKLEEVKYLNEKSYEKEI